MLLLLKKHERSEFIVAFTALALKQNLQKLPQSCERSEQQ
jgi:hypothetical protein